MANSPTDLDINIKINSDDSKKQINTINEQFNNLKTTVDDTNKSFEDFSIDKFSKNLFDGVKTVNLGLGEGVKKAEAFKETIASLGNKIELGTKIFGRFTDVPINAYFTEIRNNVVRVVMPFTDLLDRVSRFQRITSTLISTIQVLNPNLHNTSTHLSNLSNNTNQANNSVSGFSQNSTSGLNEVKLGVMAVAGSFMYLGKITSETASEFDKSMRNVNSIAQDSEDTFKKVRESVRFLSDDPKIIDGPKKIAEGMYTLVSSGFSTAQSLNLVAEASKSASAGLTNTQTAVTAVSALMNGFNQKSLKDGIEFNDKLFRIVDKGVITFEQLATNLGSVIPVAAAAGISFDEVGAGFIELTKAGISASEAETAMAGLLRELSNPSPDAFKWAKYLGVDISELAIKTKGVNGVMKELGLATHGSLGLMQKIIPETRAAKAALILVANEGKNLDKSLGDMKTSQGTRDKALEQQAKSSAFAFEKLKVSLEDLKIEYGQIINDAIVPMLKYLKTFIDYLKNLDQGTKETIVNIGFFTVALGGALIATQGLIFASKGLSIAWTMLERHPIFIVIGGVAGTFYLIDKAVQSLANSTGVWGQALHDTLDTLNLIGKIKNFGNYLDASGQNAVEEKDKQKAITTYEEEYPEFKKRESYAKRDKSNKTGLLPLDDYKKQLKILNEVFTFSKENTEKEIALDKQNYDSKIKLLNKKIELGRLNQQEYAEGVSLAKKQFEADKVAKSQDFNIIKNERVRISAIIKPLETKESTDKEDKKRKSLESAEFEKKTKLAYEEEQKRLQELASKKKSLASDVISTIKKLEDELESSKKENYEVDISRFEKEKNERKKTFTDAKNLGIITQSEYYANVGKSQEVFNAQLSKLQKDFSKSLNDDNLKATKNKYDQEREELKKEYEYRKNFLASLKKQGVNTTADEKINEVVYDVKSKKINEEQKKANEDDLENTKQLKRNSIDFLEDIQKKKDNLNATELEREKTNNKDSLRELIKKYEDEKKVMTEAKDIYGKRKFTPQNIGDFSNKFSEKYKAYQTALDDSLAEKTLAKSYIEQVDEIKNKIQDLSGEEDLLRGEKLAKDKEFWGEIKKLALEALDPKNNLSEDDTKKFKVIKKEAEKSENKDEEAKIKLAKEGMNKLAGATQEVLINMGLLNKDTAQAFSSIITFENGSLEATKSLKDGLNALSGADGKGGGLQGITSFMKDGGDISGVLGLANLMISQAKGMISAFTDNLRKPENWKDLIDIANQIADDFFNVLSLGASKGIKNLLGIKDQKTLFEDKKTITESEIKLEKDKEKAYLMNYDLQKTIIFRTIKDETLRTQKIKELDSDLAQSQFNFLKEKNDLDAKINTDKIASIGQTYEIEKSAIEDSVGNWELRNKKLDVLFMETKQKIADQVAEFAKLDSKLNSSNDIQKMIEDTKIELNKLDNSNLSKTDKEKQQLSAIQDLAIKLLDVKKQGWKDVESLMSNYYDKETQAIKKAHQSDFDAIQTRQKAIALNDKQINKFQYELDKIEARFAKLLDNKTLSKQSKSEFDVLVNQMQLQEGGSNFSNLARTSPTEFLRKIASEKEKINAQYEADGNLENRSNAMKKLAVEQNVYWGAISKNITKGTKEYDAVIKNQNDSFKDFKDAVKDSLEAQKEYEIKNKEVDGSIVNLKDSIQSLTDKNKDMSQEINKYNNNIQKDLDTLTSKFKTSAGDWETDLKKVRDALTGITTDSKSAISELDTILAKKSTAEAKLKDIVKDPSQPIVASNIQPTAIKTVQTTPSPTPSTTIKPWIRQNKDQFEGESWDNFIARIKKEDAINNAKISSTGEGTIKGTADFSSANTNPKPITNFASGSLTNATSNQQIGMFDKLGPLGFINPMNWFADGGVGVGSKAGYPAMLHGKELILNQTQGDNLWNLYKLAMTPAQTSNNNVYNQAPNQYNFNINGSNLSADALKIAIISTYNEIKQNESLSYRYGY